MILNTFFPCVHTAELLPRGRFSFLHNIKLFQLNNNYGKQNHFKNLLGGVLAKPTIHHVSLLITVDTLLLPGGHCSSTIITITFCITRPFPAAFLLLLFCGETGTKWSAQRSPSNTPILTSSPRALLTPLGRQDWAVDLCFNAGKRGKNLLASGSSSSLVSHRLVFLSWKAVNSRWCKEKKLCLVD